MQFLGQPMISQMGFRGIMGFIVQALMGGLDVGLRPTFVQGEPSGSKNIAGPKDLITTNKFHKKKRTRKEELVL
jgi:hypothetical protein